MVDDNPANWLPYSFHRPPQWRLQRADHRIEHGFPADPLVDDEWVEVAVLLRSESTRQTVSIETQKALEIRQANQCPRWLLEAYLLTDLPFLKIAQLCSLPEETVLAYHQLFFDVRSKIKATDWVLHHLLRYRSPEDDTGDPMANLWRQIAFSAGSNVLEIVVAVTLNNPLPNWLTGTFCVDYRTEDLITRLQVRLTLSALSARSDRELGKLAKLYKQIIKLKREIGLPVLIDDASLKLYGDFLSRIGTKKRRAREPKLPNQSPSKTRK